MRPDSGDPPTTVLKVLNILGNNGSPLSGTKYIINISCI